MRRALAVVLFVLAGCVAVDSTDSDDATTDPAIIDCLETCQASDNPNCSACYASPAPSCAVAHPGL